MPVQAFTFTTLIGLLAAMQPAWGQSDGSQSSTRTHPEASVVCKAAGQQIKVDLPDLSGYITRQSLRSFGEASASGLPEGTLTDVCALRDLLVGRRVSGYFRGAYEVFVFASDGRFLKYVESGRRNTLSTGTYQVVEAPISAGAAARVPTVAIDASGDFDFRVPVAPRVVKGKIEFVFLADVPGRASSGDIALTQD